MMEEPEEDMHYEVLLGASMGGSGPGVHLLKYDFLPQGVDFSKPGFVAFEDSKVTANLPHPDPDHYYELTGKRDAVTDCVLIWDPVRKVFLLERVDCMIPLRKPTKVSKPGVVQQLLARPPPPESVYQQQAVAPEDVIADFSSGEEEDEIDDEDEDGDQVMHSQDQTNDDVQEEEQDDFNSSPIQSPQKNHNGQGTSHAVTMSGKPVHDDDDLESDSEEDDFD